MGRALVAIGMLCGLFVVAAAQLAGFALVLRVLPPVPPGPLPASSAVAYMVLCLILFGCAGALFVALGAGLGRALRSRRYSPPGAVVDPDQAPDLWELVRELAASAGTRPPDEIRLMAEMNIRSEETLLRGRRLLSVGLPLLQIVTLGQMRFGLAHHVEHLAAGHARARGIAEWCGMVITGAGGRLRPGNPAGWAFRAYAWVYTLIDGAVRRRQERRCDAAGARVAGPVAAVGALSEMTALQQVQSVFYDSYVWPGWEASEYTPADLFGGFAEFVAARKTEVDDLRAEPLSTTWSWRDPYPSQAARVAAVTARFPVSDVAADERPAALLLPDLAAAGKAVHDADPELVARPALDWPEFTHVAVTAQLQHRVDVMLRAIGLTGSGLPEVLRLLEEGRLADAARPLFPDAVPEDLPELFVPPLEMFMNLAAIRSGQATWRHSWTEPAELFTPDGVPLDLSAVAERAITDPRGATAELAALGMDEGGRPGF
ncbi:M48 family metallopeptidase [Herbidospora mongoliensis]|uniref:M48 family metallopeptidase n=1 Tax=Herbidospora mongoliensis TaxID=688067 RepID=UPI000832651B|nr:M48 family metallopeptidase [Herbidospora mongoliensis]